MNSGGPGEHNRDAGEADRLRGTVSADAVSVDLVSAFAGDRVLTGTEGARILELMDRRGEGFYSDLLYAISHQYFAPKTAENLWNKVLAHKLMLSEKLERNVRITVATLDYLANITGELSTFTLMSETYVATIVNLSMRDGMTGLYNHSTCYELLDLELRNHRRYGVGVAFILLDLDDFKCFNDSWGHQAGDELLFELARTIKAETRASDICCRFGGEEFAVILPFTKDAGEASKTAERIRSGVSRIAVHGQAVTVSVSVGVALCDDGNQASHSLIERADRALYQAKRNGKNQVVVSGTGPATAV